MQAREKVEKSRVTVFLHAVVARSTFQSQKVENTSVSDHLWKLTCRKSARRSGANHTLKSKGTKHLMFEVRNTLEVEMSKKCTPVWREAHFSFKMYKTPRYQTTFGSWHVEKVHAVVARRWQHEKRSNSARLPQFLNLTTSETQQFCETSSIFKVGNIKSEAILRDVLEKWKVECRSDGLVPMCFCGFFHSICVKCCACHEKVRSGHTKCCTCHAKSS